MIIHHDPVDFIPRIQRWLNIWKPINVIQYISKLNEKTRVILIKIPTQFFIELEQFANSFGITKIQHSENYSQQ